MKKQRFIIKDCSGQILIDGKYATIIDVIKYNKYKLSNANLGGSNLSGSDLEGCDLSWSNLRGSNLSWSNLSWSNLSGSNLSVSNLSESNLRGSNLGGCDLSWSNLKGSNLGGSNLRGSDLEGCDLSWSNLSESDLRGSNLRGSDLRGSDLEGCDLSCTNIQISFSVDIGNIYYKSVNVIDNKIYSPSFNKDFQWEIGKTYTCKDFNDDKRIKCAEGFHLFTKIQAYNWEGIYLLKVKVLKGKICVPYASDGKFRVEKLKVLELIDKKDVDLSTL
jgi:uncharacterized protein YjbI with pentapeptide repeats